MAIAYVVVPSFQHYQHDCAAPVFAVACPIVIAAAAAVVAFVSADASVLSAWSE